MVMNVKHEHGIIFPLLEPIRTSRKRYHLILHVNATSLYFQHKVVAQRLCMILVYICYLFHNTVFSVLRKYMDEGRVGICIFYYFLFRSLQGSVPKVFNKCLLFQNLFCYLYVHYIGMCFFLKM